MPASSRMRTSHHSVQKHGPMEKSRSTGGRGESLFQVSALMWRPLLVVAMYWVLQWERSDLSGAFVRTMIACPRPIPRNGWCPKGSFFEDGACRANPPGSQEWSGSGMCADQFVVVAQATAVVGRMSSVCGLCGLFASAFIGSTLVDTVGRRPIMLLALLGSSICTAFFLAACFTSASVSVSLLFLGSIQFALVNSFDVATNAMTADLLCNSIALRGLGYAAVNIAMHVGILLAFVCGFFILALDLTNYTRVWAVVLAVSIVFNTMSHWLLRETMSQDNHDGDGETDPFQNSGAQVASPNSQESERRDIRKKRSFGGGRSGLASASSGLIACFRMVWEDGFLRMIMVLSLLAQMAGLGAISITGGYTLYVAGMTQAVGSLAGVFQPAAILCGNAASATLRKAMGTYASFMLGLVIATGGFLTVGLGAVHRARAQALFWLGFITLGLGWGITGPSFMALVSIRIPDTTSHGKLFAAINFANSVGGTLGAFIWSNFLFKGGFATSWIGGLGWFVSTAIYVVMAFGYLALFRWYLYTASSQEARPPEVRADPVAIGAHAGTWHMDSTRE